MNELKPCPFCGDEPARMTELEEKDDRRYYERTIECDRCFCTMSDTISWGEYCKITPEQANEQVGEALARIWNTRVN